MSTVHCGNVCVTQPSQQYPGAGGGQPPSVYITGGGTLPFTGADAILFLLVAVILVATGYATRRLA